MNEEATATGLEVVWDGPVLRLTIAREKAGNALAAATLVALREALDEAARSDEVRVVALTAVGKNFCTGVDLAEANAPMKVAEGEKPVKPRIGHHSRRIDLGAHGLVEAFTELRLPVVVGVRGWAAGIGNSLALLSDYIVASETAKFWTPFVGRGFTPDSGSTWLLPRLIGLARAKEMVLLGRPVDAARAERWGMVNDVVPDAELEKRFEETVQEFAAAATVSVGLAKVMLHRHLDADLGQALREESLMEEVSLRSADFKEGIASLRERRAPNYEGR
ncbi:enoyl-CoA hydratase-related protein [Pseudonocardia sp. NPDC049154]|uniref:enoyl-CoA hydratase/isomerase family protein n=1 Tax=Pseudonocardia sp. NPDC049154 TaxID=3155501 RepID=UPI0033EFAA5B